MTEQSPAEAVFFAALEKGTPEERAAYLDAACAHDPDLRRRVERLLAAHPQVGNFLEAHSGQEPAAPGTVETGPDRGQGEAVGSILAGRYKLLEQIGEGGMGTVWVAEQTQPVRRKVAVKLVKAGMDSKAVLTRFEAERQALALMDHPHIAKVLDGGTTDTGRPFFVMEYVKGVPITRYCDDARLSIAQRLALFVPVCQAVQHAHQKGIIHRDLKPSNVLICLYDGNPVPKVIDFGLAKAMHQPLTERTLYTAHGVMMGTPLYMSPEQAELNNLDVDTRTDIYALGVILYELLTGTTPLEKGQFQKAAWHEILRLIKETEPPCPSARLSGSSTLPSLAAQRQLEPVKLTRLVRGELDWIVMKCLEKDRSRRYDTAAGLARDVERYLADDVVEARPPSAAYRLRKFVRKHRIGLVTALAFAMLLLAAAGISSILAIMARRAEDIAEQKKIEAQANAEKAERLSGQLWKSIGENMEARYKAELQAAGFELDLALGELRNSNQRVGLLQLARFLKKPKEVVEYPFDGSSFSGKVTAFVNDGPEFQRLREFAAMAVLATGQNFAPLLPPITHDGAAIRSSSIHSPTGERLLTLDMDKTARLWDPFSGRQIAMLRRADEKVIGAGLSPDGATAFTHSLDGVLRLWETKDGAFRAETDPRPERIKSFRDGLPAPFPETASFPRDVTELSDDRLLTKAGGWHESNGGRGWSYFGPVELWDAKTGRFVARLELPKLDPGSCRFFGSGQWILAHETSEQIPHVFSAKDGRSLARLIHPKGHQVPYELPSLSPSGRTAATLSATGANEYYADYYVHLWETSSWKLLSTTGPLKMASPGIELIADDLFAMTQRNGHAMIFRPTIVTPITELPDSIRLSLGDRVILYSHQLYDTRTWRRLQPPKGRKYHPDLKHFAPDGRFVPVEFDTVEPQFLDTMTEKISSMGRGSSFYQAKLGWVGGWVGYNDNGSEIALQRFPPPDRLDIPPDLLELWAQVAVRGHLDDEGAFVPWNEATWEKKRQELAAKPAPYPDFPFPGHVAVDRLHWLRAEFENANEQDKSRLAKQLLARAEAAGDKAEAARWRRWFAPKANPPTSK